MQTCDWAALVQRWAFSFNCESKWTCTKTPNWVGASEREALETSCCSGRMGEVTEEKVDDLQQGGSTGRWEWQQLKLTQHDHWYWLVWVTGKRAQWFMALGVSLLEAIAFKSSCRTTSPVETGDVPAFYLFLYNASILLKWNFTSVWLELWTQVLPLVLLL